MVAALYQGSYALPGVWLGSFALNLGIAWNSGGVTRQSVLVALIIGLGACLQAWLANYLVQWRLKNAWQRLDQDSDIIGFLILAGPMACLVSSSWATLTLLLFEIINWSECGFTWWNWWAGDSLGVLLFAPILLNFLFLQEPSWQIRLRLVVMPTLILMLIVIVSYVYASEKDAKLLKYRIDAYGQSLSYLIKQKLQTYQETLGALSSLMSIKPDLNQVDFAAFSEPFFVQHNDIHALSWNPVVTQAQRISFEQHYGKQNQIAHFSISERNQQQELVPAQLRDWYVAVGYIAPLAKNAKALGYDIASNPDRLGAIKSALQTRQLTATPPIRLVQDSDNRAGLLLLQPVYAKKRQHDDMPAGFAVGVFKIEQMFIQQTGKYLPNHMGFSLEDLDATSGSRLIYQTQTPLITGQHALTWTCALNFAGRNWQISLYPTTEFLADERSLFAWSVLATGLIVASMLQAMLLGMTGRTYAIQHQVNQKTQEIMRQSAVLQENQNHLQQEKEKYELLMHASGDGIHILDQEGRVVEANQKFCDLLGYRHDEVIGMHVSQWEAFFDPEAAASKIKENFERANLFETRHRRKSGEILDVEVSAKAVNIAGQCLLWNASRDIGERKRLQQALTQAKESAEHAAALKSRFLANMSHEIRTPMNGIIGLTQLSLEQPMNAELKGFLEKILLSAQTLLGILNDILDLSKIEAGHMLIEQLPFDLTDMLSNVQNLLGARAREKGLLFEFNIDPKIPNRLLGDALRLQQILINLAGNAVKFTLQGYVRIGVQVLQQNTERVYLRFSVSDSGIGIPSEKLEKLFIPFNQLDDSISRRFGGTGLGLTISNDLLKLMQSQLEVESQIGKGSLFSFSLWLALAPRALAAAHPQSNVNFSKANSLSTILQDSNRPLAGLKMLVAEDNAINQLVISKFLGLMAIEFAVVNNGQEAITALETQAFDVVLMDVGMPVMDGREATRLIRQNSKYANLPIIALSAGITEDERRQCLACGMNDFIGKPIDPKLFVVTISRYVTKRPTTNNLSNM